MNILEATICGFLLALWVSIPVALIVSLVATGGQLTGEVFKSTYIATGIILTFVAVIMDERK